MDVGVVVAGQSISFTPQVSLKQNLPVHFKFNSSMEFSVNEKYGTLIGTPH